MTIAVIIPARDAAHLLRDCVDAVLSQTLPPDEVLLSVAPSSDDTRHVAETLADGKVRVVENAAGDRGSAINAALDVTDADVVAMVDAQSRIGAEYLERAVAALDADPQVAVVGGPMRPEGQTTIGRAIALALRSPFGVGDSQFHFEGEAQDVDSVYLGVYRRSVFEQVGRYNPALLRTEDDDLNARVREVGLRIRLDPAIRSRYLCRNSLGGLWRQYFGYGYWKVALATIRPSALRLRHLVPAAFVVAVAVAAVVAVLGIPVPLLLLAGAYLLAAAGFAVATGATDASALLLFPLVTLTMHVAYGVGTLSALPSWGKLRADVSAAASGVGVSR